jgi:hypothetical protein
MKLIKWDYIFILIEFIEQLIILDLAEVSLLNKFIREKLMSVIFSKAELNNIIFKTLPFSNIVLTNKLIFSDIKDRRYNDLSYLKSTIIEPSVNELINQVNTFSSYSKSLKFYNLYGSAYFLMPLAFHFNQLAYLTFYNCVVDLYDFKELMIKLGNLESLVLYDLRLLKLLDYGPIESEVLIPTSLKFLSVSHLNIDTASVHNSQQEHFFDTGITTNRDVYLIPPKHYPSLKKFQIDYANDITQYVIVFLSLNPQLTCVSLPLKNLYLNVIELLSVGNSIEQLTINTCYFDDGIQSDDNIPVLQSLSSLHITMVHTRVIPKVYSIIDAFLETRNLEIDLVDYDIEFITNMVGNLPQLKSLIIRTDILSINDINLEIYEHIDVLKLYIHTDKETFYKLPSQPAKAKFISITSGARFIENYNYLKDTYNESNWEIKLIKEVINCKVKKD